MSEGTYRDKVDIEQCARCGYCEFKGSLHVHHINRNKNNNNTSNLVVLCGNCHMGLHHGEWKLEDIGLVTPEIKNVKYTQPDIRYTADDLKKGREAWYTAMCAAEREMIQNTGLTFRND
jgi:hypothetical protein